MIPSYRAWDKDAECMIYQEDNGDEYVWQIGTEDIWIEPIHGMTIPRQVLMQSTGLKDKNGVEIFERDIIKNSNGLTGYVTYLQQEAGFVVVLKKSDYRLGHRNTGESYTEATNHEVIGNIYQNSELLDSDLVEVER